MQVKYGNYFLNKIRINDKKVHKEVGISPNKIFKTHLINKVFYIRTTLLRKKVRGTQYSKLPSICNKQGYFKRSFNGLFLNRHVLLKHLRGGSGFVDPNTLYKKTW